MTQQPFELKRFLGKWHDLLHTPSFFQKNHNYNTTAEYTLSEEGVVTVINSTCVNGKSVSSRGEARQFGKEPRFRVDFDRGEIAKFGGGYDKKKENTSEPNYIIERVWVGEEPKDSYQFAVVHDPKTKSLWVLSRTSAPVRQDYEQVLSYVLLAFPELSDRLVATPHYH